MALLVKPAFMRACKCLPLHMTLKDSENTFRGSSLYLPPSLPQPLPPFSWLSNIFLGVCSPACEMAKGDRLQWLLSAAAHHYAIMGFWWMRSLLGAHLPHL